MTLSLKHFVTNFCFAIQHANWIRDWISKSCIWLRIFSRTLDVYGYGKKEERKTKRGKNSIVYIMRHSTFKELTRKKNGNMRPNQNLFLAVAKTVYNLHSIRMSFVLDFFRRFFYLFTHLLCPILVSEAEFAQRSWTRTKDLEIPTKTNQTKRKQKKIRDN